MRTQCAAVLAAAMATHFVCLGLSAEVSVDADIVIYGSSPAAIAAAVQAKRMGVKAVVVSPETRIGGLTTGGLGQTDIGSKSAFGGIALEFYKDVARWYAEPSHWKHGKMDEYFPDGACAGTKGRDSMWTFEPSASLAILEGWERRDKLDIRRGERLDRGKGVVKKEGRIVSIETLSGNVYCGKVFIDATYEGDLMAAAGVSYHVGREANAVYGETVNGNAPNAVGARHHNFHDDVSPYVVEGDSKSGLLPGVEAHNTSERPGDGDSRVQAYCFRMCLTDVPENRIPFAKPEGYDERDYELLFREYAAMARNPGWKVRGCLGYYDPPVPFIMSRMPNGKTDSNNRTGFSSDFVGGNWRWPEASYEERDAIFRRHLDYQRGLMWTLANHPRIPEGVRSYFSKWGTCRDEFQDGPGDGWQSQLYVREARRMVGETVMTERHCRGSQVSRHPVAMAAYGIDSHHVRRVVTADGFVRNEGNVEDYRSADMKTPIKPYGIDYGAIVPKRGECANLLVPVCLSASHVAFGSIRMEPVFFALGQAAGTAACLACESGVAVQDVDYSMLCRRLLDDGQVLPPSAVMASGMNPVVPVFYRQLGVEVTCEELRRINAATGLGRFFLCGPCFNDVMFGPFPDDLYAKIGEDVAAVKRGLADTGIEISWWCSPSIRYFSDFPSIEDSAGHKSQDNKKCPLDEAFVADYAAKVQSVAKAHPAMICIEDDFTLSWGRGLNGGACYCRRHLAEFAKRYGKALPAKEIANAFRRRSDENLAVRSAFADTVRESLVSLAHKVRAAVDEVDPSIRIMICEAGGADKDGDAIEAVARAFAGRTRPAVRPRGAIYGAETTPASIPTALAHAVWTIERLPKDIETFFEADAYPHNRFYSSASQLLSTMAGATMAGSDDFLFYCLQYLDDPLEDAGYADAFLALKPRLDAVRRFIAEHEARLSGARIYWRAEDLSLTRGYGYSHGQQLSSGAYMLSKFGIPYTTRADGGGPVLLLGEVAETMTDDEIRELLSGGILMDAPAAVLLSKRGFGDFLGVDVAPVNGRPRITDERIRSEAGCKRRGRQMNAFYVFPAGSEGTAERFAELKPHKGTEVWSDFYGPDGSFVMPSVVFSRNRLGGRVGIVAMSLIGNRSSGLYNLRKQELLRRLLDRLSPGTIPVSAVDVPGIWLMASVSSDGKEMLLMVNNLSGDDREGVRLSFAGVWRDAEIARLGVDGAPVPCGRVDAVWTVPFALGQMKPEFLILKR